MKLPFQKKSFDSITSSLNKTVAELQALAKTNAEEASNHRIAIVERQNMIESLDAEGSKAEAVAKKLEALIS